jgi:hypothetical protein
MTPGKPGSHVAKEAAAKLAASVRSQVQQQKDAEAAPPQAAAPAAPAASAAPAPAAFAPPMLASPTPPAASAPYLPPPAAASAGRPAVTAPVPMAAAGPGRFPGPSTAGAVPSGGAATAPPGAAPRSAVPPAAGSLGTGAATATATKARPAPTPSAAANRRVRLTVSRVDPWSVMKLSFLLSVAIGIALVVVVAVLWLILDGMGVFTSVNRTISDVAGSSSTFDLMDYIALPRVLSLAVVIGVIDVILLTALSTLSAFLYNLCSSLVGGVQLTLSDD